MREDLSHLPGGKMIMKGLKDLAEGKVSVESCLVKLASPQLVRAKLLTEASKELDTELILYELLRKSESNAFSTYNSLLRTLSSFEHSLALIK